LWNFSHLGADAVCLGTIGLAANPHHPAYNRWTHAESHAGVNSKTGISFQFASVHRNYHLKKAVTYYLTGGRSLWMTELLVPKFQNPIMFA
jgi:hypothetical protein